MFRIDPLTRAGVDGRSRVHDLVRSDVGRAAEEARKIQHPWYRCQSLAAVAEVVKLDAGAAAMLREALAAAHEQTEPNRVVSVASWPIKVMIRRRVAGAETAVAKLLALIATEPNPIRRANALILLLDAVFPEERLRAQVLEHLLAALQASRGWKSRRLLQFTAGIMVAESVAAAERICALIPPSKEARRAWRMVQSDGVAPLGAGV